MGTKTMKGVEEETWAEFRSLAARNRMKTGKFFEKLIKSYKQNTNDFWNEILTGEKILSELEAKDMQIITKNMRKERGWRV